MSELLDISPPLATSDAESSALENFGNTSEHIDFDTLSSELQYIDPNMKATDYDHYMQEVRIMKINLTYLDAAKAAFVSGDYAGCKYLFEVIIEHVKPTNNLYLLGLLTEAHDTLYR